jgi:AraC-like DNA-binding protein
MREPSTSSSAVERAWQAARSGELRRAVELARAALGGPSRDADHGRAAELHLVCASCAMRQGDHVAALHDLDAAESAAARTAAGSASALRVQAWRAELAYFQGRYSDASDILERLLPALERAGDRVYAAFVLRTRIAVLLARRDYAGIDELADRAVATAAASGDDYVRVQVLNVLGASHFDRATTKLREPHARAHLSALDRHDTAPMEDDARKALRCFEQARAVAESAKLDFAAWYVAGNIERLEILLGHAERAVHAIRKRLRVLQAGGARYDEIVARSNLAWGLRLLGRHREALHELDVALEQARATRTANVLLEFLEYDRSVVLYALGQSASARVSYRRYLALAGATTRPGDPWPGRADASGSRRPLEPYLLKRADRYLVDNIAERVSAAQIAKACGVSLRTLEKAFADFRGITPVAHARNLRLDHAHRALLEGEDMVAQVAARFGFRSATTFALEYRKRFGASPVRTKRGG